MPDLRILGVSKDADLSTLNTIIRQREHTFAPVVAIQLGETSEGKLETGITFDASQNHLTAKFARAKLSVAGAAVVAADETLVCEGKAYLSGTATAVFLVRPK
jgi:hypothetical protein